jgi:hypothetical protein
MSTMCEHRDEMLVALLYDEGDPAELAAARAHLAECADCRREYEELAGVSELLGAWPNVTNAPRIVYVADSIGFMTRIRRWVDELGSLGLGSLVRPAAALAATAMVIVIAVSVIRFQVGPDGVVQVAFGPRTVEPAAQMAAGDTGAEAVPVTREEFAQAMQEMAGYLNELVQNTRAQDRQIVMAALSEQLDERDLRLTDAVLTAVNDAFSLDFNNLGRRLDGLTLAYQDLRDITGSELQKTNAILAALLQPGELRERK